MWLGMVAHEASKVLAMIDPYRYLLLTALFLLPKQCLNSTGTQKSTECMNYKLWFLSDFSSL